MATPRKSKAKKSAIHDDFHSNAAVPPDVFKLAQIRSPLCSKSPSKPTLKSSDAYESGLVGVETPSKTSRPQEISTDKLSRSVTPTYLHTPKTCEPLEANDFSKLFASQRSMIVTSPNLSAASAKQLSTGVNRSQPRRARAKSAERHSHQSSVSPVRTGSRTPEFFPPSHYAAAAGLSNSSISHKTNIDKFAATRKDSPFTSKLSSISPEFEAASTFSSSLRVSSLPVSAAQSVKRRRTFSRSPKITKEKDENFDVLSETRNLVRRASQLGLPDLEKDLLPSLNDTINKMTQSIKQHSLANSENRINELSSLNSDMSSVTFRNHHMGPLLSPAVIPSPTLGMPSSSFSPSLRHLLDDNLPNDESSRTKSAFTSQNDSDPYALSRIRHNLDKVDKKLRPEQNYFDDHISSSENIFHSKGGHEVRQEAAQVISNVGLSTPGDPNISRRRQRVKPVEDMLDGSLSLPSSPIGSRDNRECLGSPHERGGPSKSDRVAVHATHSKIPQPSPSAKTKRSKNSAKTSFQEEVLNPAPASNYSAGSAPYTNEARVHTLTLNTEGHFTTRGNSNKKKSSGSTLRSRNDDFILSEKAISEEGDLHDLHSRPMNINDIPSSPRGLQVHTGARLSSASPERRRQAIQRLVVDLGLDESNRDAVVSAQEPQQSLDNIRASPTYRRRSKVFQDHGDRDSQLEYNKMGDPEKTAETEDKIRDSQIISKPKACSTSKSYEAESSEHVGGYSQSDQHIRTSRTLKKQSQLKFGVTDSDKVKAQSSSNNTIRSNTTVLGKQKHSGQSSFEYDDGTNRLNDTCVRLEIQAQNSKDRSSSSKTNSDDVSFSNIFSSLEGSRNNRDSITLNADRQRRAFGIPPFESELNINNIVSQSESDASIYSTSSFVTSEGSSTGLSVGAERLFQTLERIATESEGESYKGSANMEVFEDKNTAQVERSTTQSESESQLSSCASGTSIDKFPGDSLLYRAEDHNQIITSEDGHVSSTWQCILSGPSYAGLVEKYGYAEMQRQELIWELCESELSYVRDLQMALKLFVHPLLTKDRVWMAGISTMLTKLFDWLDDIYQLHTKIYSAFRKMRSLQYPVVLRFGESLLQYVPRLEIYQPYLGRINEVTAFIDRIMKDTDSDFGEFVRIQSGSEACLGRSLNSFLILPIERLTKYQETLKAIREVTPREHIDHLPTFTLYHSISAIIHVMNEVKAREEEYVAAKSIFSRIKGLPDPMAFVSRDRRLLAHGQLEQIIIGRKDKLTLDCSSSFSRYQSSASDFNSDITPFCKAPYHKDRNIPQRRSISLDHSSSEIYQSSLSDLSNSEDEAVGIINGAINNHDVSQSNVQPDKNIKRTRIRPVYAYVFTDLVLLMHTTLNGSEIFDPPNKSWQFMECIGVSRILSITEHRRQFGVDNFFGLDILPVELDKVNLDIDLTTCTDRIFVRPPLGQKSEESHYSNGGPEFRTWTRWRTVLEQCRRHTIQSLTFPPSMYSTGGTKTVRKEETESSVLAILSSGLPMPKSPSQHIGALKRGSAEDVRQLEREERGWWAIRYQQVLTELKRTNFFKFDFPSDADLPIMKERTVSSVIRPITTEVVAVASKSSREPTNVNPSIHPQERLK